jgi:hypothetical protein
LWCLERKRAAESAPTKNKRTASSFAAIVAIALGGLLLFSAAMGVLAHDTLVQHISKLGMAAIAPKLANYFAANLLRSALLAIGTGAVIWLSLRPTCLKARWPLVALALLLAIDIINVSSRFMRPMDIAPFYKSNVVTDTIWQQADATAPRVINYVTGNDPGTDWFTSSILRNNIALAIPTDPTDKIAPLFQPLAKQTETLWRATFTRYVIVKAAAAQQLIAAKRLTPLLFFNLSQGVARKNNPSNDAFMLATFNQALPPAYMVNRWQGGIEPSDQLKQLASPGWDPVTMTLCNAPAESPAIGLGQLVGTTRLMQKRGANLNLKTVV